MKRFFAILLMICMLASMICIAAVPASAAGGDMIFVGAFANNGRVWALGYYGDLEEAWNDAVYFSTNLDEAWDRAYEFDLGYEREDGENFVRILVEFYGDWSADSNGSFGSGIGFKDGALYAPRGSKIEVKLNGGAITCKNASDRAFDIGAGANVKIYDGTVIGEIYADKNANLYTHNIYVAGNTARSAVGASRFGSIFGEGSLSMIVAFTALIASVASIVVNVSGKIKASPEAKNNAADNDEEE